MVELQPEGLKGGVLLAWVAHVPWHGIRVELMRDPADVGMYDRQAAVAAAISVPCKHVLSDGTVYGAVGVPFRARYGAGITRRMPDDHMFRHASPRGVEPIPYDRTIRGDKVIPCRQLVA